MSNLKTTQSTETANTAFESLIQSISEMIENHEINIGDRFPSERDLAKRYSTSRNTVRSALRHFESMGIVKIVRGSGCYLSDNSDALYKIVETHQLLAKYNLFEMIETRRILEVGIIRLAASRATRKDVLRLRKMLELMNSNETAKTKDADNHKTYTALDYELHREFAKIAGNSMLLEMFTAIKDSFMRAEEVWEMSKKDIRVASDAHERIIDAIAEGNPDKASLEMRKHLDIMEEMVSIAVNGKESTANNPSK